MKVQDSEGPNHPEPNSSVLAASGDHLELSEEYYPHRPLVESETMRVDAMVFWPEAFPVE